MRKRSPLYKDFKEWFLANRDSFNIPPYTDLGKRYGVKASTIEKWVHRLGGFTHDHHERSVLCKVESAHSYLRGCNRPIGLKALLIASGYEITSASNGTGHPAVKLFLKALQDHYPDDFAKIKKGEKDYNDDNELISWGRRYLRLYGCPAPINIVAKQIGRSHDYATKRVQTLLDAYPDAPFVIGDIWKELKSDSDFQRKCVKGRRKREREWSRWLEVNEPEGLGFEFKGEYWDRYLLLWELRRRGYVWESGQRGTCKVIDFEAGYVIRLKTFQRRSIEEALNEETIR